MSPDTSASGSLLHAAATLLVREDTRFIGLWPRASAVLARQAVEVAINRLWARRAPAVAECSMRAQLLCLASYVNDDHLAAETANVWGALSRACHYHPYELAPTADELVRWIDSARHVVAELERRSG